jgi:hypothetical protein
VPNLDNARERNGLIDFRRSKINDLNYESALIAQVHIITEYSYVRFLPNMMQNFNYEELCIHPFGFYFLYLKKTFEL